MEYYVLKGKERKGPFSLDDLKNQDLNIQTFIWHEGLEDWKRLGELEELRKLIYGKVTLPPPIPKEIKEEEEIIIKKAKSKSVTLSLAAITITVVSILVAYFYSNYVIEESRKDIMLEINDIFKEKYTACDWRITKLEGVLDKLENPVKKKGSKQVAGLDSWKLRDFQNKKAEGITAEFYPEYGGFTIYEITKEIDGYLIVKNTSNHLVIKNDYYNNLNSVQRAYSESLDYLTEGKNNCYTKCFSKIQGFPNLNNKYFEIKPPPSWRSGENYVYNHWYKVFYKSEERKYTLKEKKELISNLYFQNILVGLFLGGVLILLIKFVTRSQNS